MRLSDRPSNIVAAVFTLVIAGVIGLAVPLAWGTLAGGTGAPLMVPALVRNGVTDLPTATAEPQTPTATSTATRSPSQTRTPWPAWQSQGGQPQRAATNAIEALRLVTPTNPPRQPTASRTSTATALPTDAIASATPTGVPTPTASPTPVASPTTAPATQMPKAEVAVERLNLRGGPGQNYGMVGVAKAGSVFTVIARSADDAWLRVCCVNKSPAWLATEFVTVTGAIKLVPVAP